jgi:hypothetical protein
VKELMARIRCAFVEDSDRRGGNQHHTLNHWPLDASRLPVELDIEMLLQMEQGAQICMSKTKKILPSPDTNPTGDINQCNDEIEQLKNRNVIMSQKRLCYWIVLM